MGRLGPVVAPRVTPAHPSARPEGRCAAPEGVGVAIFSWELIKEGLKGRVQLQGALPHSRRYSPVSLCGEAGFLRLGEEGEVKEPAMGQLAQSCHLWSSPFDTHPFSFAATLVNRHPHFTGKKNFTGKQKTKN